MFRREGDNGGGRWSEEQIDRARADAAREYLNRVRRMSPEEFMAAFPDWANNPILSIDDSPRYIHSLGFEILRDHAGLGSEYIGSLQRFATDQFIGIYGSGVTGAALGGLPRTQATWHIITHPRPPGWKFWRSRGPEITIGCSVGASECVYGVK